VRQLLLHLFFFNLSYSIGPGRELNLRLPEVLGDQNDPNTVNEIQFPVEKV